MTIYVASPINRQKDYMRNIMQQSETITDRDNVLFESGIKLGALLSPVHRFSCQP
ncbi:MAG: hypothetical protein R2741_06610 [Methanolobus sp.]